MTKKPEQINQNRKNKLPGNFNVVQLKGERAIRDAKKLDDKAFEGHQKISIHELSTIAEQVGLYGIFQDENIVAEAQLMFEDTDFYNLEFQNSAYCYGIAVDADFRGKGLATSLINMMEEQVRLNSKNILYLASRPENYASLQLWYKHGYKVFDYKERYFGPDTREDSRLLLYKSLTEKLNLQKTHIATLQLKNTIWDNDLRSSLVDLLSKHGEVTVEIITDNRFINYQIYID